MFSEAQFISEFYMKNLDDRKTLRGYLPDDEPLFDLKARRLPDHWSLWWDDKRRVALKLKPCPPAKAILDIFETRLLPLRDMRSI